MGEAHNPAVERVTLRGSGIRLRPLTPHDADDIHEACNDEAVKRWLPLPSPYTAADARTFISEARCEPAALDVQMTFAIERDDPTPGRLLGSIGLGLVSVPNRVYSIGYWVAPWARGEHVAARATALLAGWAIRSRGVERLELRIEPGNKASESVARACGFTYEGTMRSVEMHRDRRVDLGLYSLLPVELAQPAQPGQTA